MSKGSNTIDRIILSVKYFACKFFAQSNFCHQTLVTKTGIGQHTLHKIFRVFNFRRKRLLTKNFNNENFAIYSISEWLIKKVVRNDITGSDCLVHWSTVVHCISYGFPYLLSLHR